MGILAEMKTRQQNIDATQGKMNPNEAVMKADQEKWRQVRKPI
jgi:hypothetical protein